MPDEQAPKCELEDYIREYFNRVYIRCRIALDIGRCTDKAAMPYVYWKERCLRTKRLPEIP